MIFVSHGSQAYEICITVHKVITDKRSEHEEVRDKIVEKCQQEHKGKTRQNCHLCLFSYKPMLQKFPGRGSRNTSSGEP